MLMILIASLISGEALAQNYEIRSKPKVRVEGSEQLKEPAPKPRKKLPVYQLPVENVEAEPVSAKPESDYKWSGSVGYGLRTDLADQVKPRLYNHVFEFDLGFEHEPSHWSAGVSLTGSYESLGDRGSEVTVDSSDTELFLNDISVSIGKSWAQWAPTKMSLYLTNEFPTSADAQREEYRSITSLLASVSWPVFEKRLSSSLRFLPHYIWNTHQFSPVTGGLNKQGGVRLEGRLRLTLWRGLFAGVSAGAQVARYLDSTNDLTYRNSFSLGYDWTTFLMSIEGMNGTYLDQGDANVWYIDQYARIVSFRMSLNF